MPDKFIVPQFIDKEDQILGPITVRQFLIMLVGVLFLFITYKIFTFWYFLIFALIIGAFVLTFGFVKINGQPFHIFFINFLQTSVRPKLRVWDKRPTNAELRAFIRSSEIAPPPMLTIGKPRPESSRLRELSLVVNSGGVYRPDEENF